MFSPFVGDSTSKSSYLKTDNKSSRPPCFIFTVSWGVVFWLRLPFVMGLTMKMPVREEKQHCEKTFNAHTYIEEPPANRGTDPSFQSAVWRLSLEVCLFCFDSSRLTVGNFPAKKKKKKFKSQIFSKTHNRHVFSAVVGLSPANSNYKCIRIFSWDEMGTARRIKELFRN